jgi:flagellar hook-basal body complex protein FliE
MVVNIANALSAYQQGGTSTPASLGATASETGGSGSFGETLKGYLGDTVDALQNSEKAATNAATGKADLTSIVTAISKAEMMLQTVVTIRDKVISAYQDITKTQI